MPSKLYGSIIADSDANPAGPAPMMHTSYLPLLLPSLPATSTLSSLSLPLLLFAMMMVAVIVCFVLFVELAMGNDIIDEES
jgi:hypothetical protein